MKFVFTAAAILLLASVASAQTAHQYIPWAPLLGPAAPVAMKTTPRGIKYQSNGFDTPKQNRIFVKTPGYLTNQGASHLIASFQEFGLEMTEDSTAIPRWIDEAFADIKGKWLACGGTFEQAALSIKARTITVIVEDRPFWMPLHQLYAYGTTDGTTIRAVNISTALLFSDPPNAYLVRFKELMLWEMGNTFQVRAFGPPGSVAGEIGGASPCG